MNIKSTSAVINDINSTDEIENEYIVADSGLIGPETIESIRKESHLGDVLLSESNQNTVANNIYNGQVNIHTRLLNRNQSNSQRIGDNFNQSTETLNRSSENNTLNRKHATEIVIFALIIIVLVFLVCAASIRFLIYIFNG